MYQHEGQVKWLDNSDKLVNILRPGNQWGKTLVLAIKHIYHAMTKHELEKFNINQDNPKEWLKADYTTLNFGKTYEIAKGVHETIVSLIHGEYALVDHKTKNMKLNKSRIETAIVKHYDTELPYIIWWNGAQTLTRSTDDIGSSFKRRRLAFASGDEIGDIPDITSVLNATVLPRVAFYQGRVDLIGTPQDPGEYQDLIDLAEYNMEQHGDKSTYYTQRGTMYENPGLSQDYVRQIENTADADLRRRIIYGDFAETGERYFTLNQVQNMVNEDLSWREDSGEIEKPQETGKYVEVADYASVNDRTVIAVLRWDVTPIRLVHLRFFKGKDVPIPMQYEITREIYHRFKDVCGKFGKMDFIFDAQALGGKIAEEQLRDLHGIPFPGKGISPADAKAQALASLKGLMDEGRHLVEIEGVTKDVNSSWGGIHIPQVRPLRQELEGYKLKDDKIRNDFVIVLAMGAYFIQKRRPKAGMQRVRSIDFYPAFEGMSNQRVVNIN